MSTRHMAGRSGHGHSQIHPRWRSSPSAGGPDWRRLRTGTVGFVFRRACLPGGERYTRCSIRRCHYQTVALGNERDIAVRISYRRESGASNPDPVVPTEPLAPTATPTSTSLPPTSTPAPVALTPGLGCSWSASCEFQPVSSEGKDSLDLLLLHTGASLLRITGNAGGHHFAVWGRDANGDRTTLFVNTTDPYVGTVPLNFDEPTARLEITAVGFCTVEVLPLSAAGVADVPGIITGQSDDVVLISGTPGTTQIIGNADSRHFAVVSYGVFRDLLVNTTEPYDRRIGIPPDAIFLEVDVEGRWTIRFE